MLSFRGRKSPGVDNVLAKCHVFLDWDCTITQVHMFSFLQSKTRHDAQTFCNMLGGDRTKIAAFHSLVDNSREYYVAWGSPESAHLDTLRSLLLREEELIARDSIIRDDLLAFIFGDESRRKFLNELFVTFIDAKCDITILTKGIGASVIAAIRSFFPIWLEAPLHIRVVDYAGHIYDPRRPGNPLLGQTPPLTAKLPQIDSVLTHVAASASAPVLFIDDSYESEIASIRQKELVCTTASGWPLLRLEYLGRKYVVGGPPRNSNGLQASDLEKIRQAVVMMCT